MANKVTVEQINRCCGAYLMHSFDRMVEPITLSRFRQIYNGSATDEQHKAWLKDNCETLEEHKKRIRFQVSTFQSDWKNKKAYFLAITNSKEKQAGVDEILLDLGFEVLVPTMKNPTGTDITMFIYHLLPRKKEETKSVLKKAA